MSRKDKYKKKKHLVFGKLLVGAVLLIGIIGSGIMIAYADQDIHSILSNWFDTKRESMIEEVKYAVDKEQDTQSNRLKEALQLVIEDAEDQLNAFTRLEKRNSTTEIRSYADKLISGLRIDNTEEIARISGEFDNIIYEAISKMNEVTINDISEPDPKPGSETEEKEANIEESVDEG